QWYHHIQHPALPTTESTLSLFETIKELNERPSNDDDDDDDDDDDADDEDNDDDNDNDD
ncbi:unnamed protein product, partial [Rotaria magnacalcarata]